MNRMTKALAQLSGATVYKNAVVRILGVWKQIREDKYDHCRAARLSFFSLVLPERPAGTEKMKEE